LFHVADTQVGNKEREEEKIWGLVSICRSCKCWGLPVPALELPLVPELLDSPVEVRPLPDEEAG